jgi:hypothetical protein
MFELGDSVKIKDKSWENAIIIEEFKKFLLQNLNKNYIVLQSNERSSLLKGVNFWITNNFLEKV